MKPTTMAGWGTLLVFAALATACGGSSSDARAQREARSQGRADAGRSAEALAAAAAEADFVAAVSSASIAPPVTLKFRMEKPPRVGEPMQLDLLLQQPPQEISSILVSLQPGDGLSVLSQRSFEFRVPVPGATQHMSVTLRADAQTVLSLSATVLVDSSNTSVAYNFLIPLISVPAGS